MRFVSGQTCLRGARSGDDDPWLAEDTIAEKRDPSVCMMWNFTIFVLGYVILAAPALVLLLAYIQHHEIEYETWHGLFRHIRDRRRAKRAFPVARGRWI